MSLSANVEKEGQATLDKINEEDDVEFIEERLSKLVKRRRPSSNANSNASSVQSNVFLFNLAKMQPDEPARGVSSELERQDFIK